MAVLKEDPLTNFEKWKIQEEDIEKGELVRQEIEKIVNREMKELDISVELAGSCRSRVGVHGADVDLTLISTNTHEPILSKLTNQLRNSTIFTVMRFVSDARIPIIDVCHKSTSKRVNISLNTKENLTMAYLLRAYADMNPLLEPMIVYVKRWAMQHKLIDAKYHFFSGFILTVMIIFHQQQKNNMFVIQNVTKATSEEDIREHVEANKIDVKVTSGRLRQELKDFFKYYTSFNFRHKVINIRTGETDHRRFASSKQAVLTQHPIRPGTFDNCSAFIRDVKLSVALHHFRQAGEALLESDGHEAE